MRRALRFVPAIWIMGMIFFFSGQNGTASSGVSGKVCRILAEMFLPGFGGLDEAARLEIISQMSFWVRKAAHMSIYFALGAAWMFGFAGVPALSVGRRAQVSALCGILYSLTDEFHQSFSPGRSPELRDVLIDSTGVILGVLAVGGFYYFKEKRRKAGP